MSQPAFEAGFAFADGGGDHGNDASRSETESFPLLANGAGRQLPPVGLSKCEGILVSDNLIIRNNPDEPHTSKLGLRADQCAVELCRPGPGAKMAWFALSEPMEGVLLHKAVEFLLNFCGVADYLHPGAEFLVQEFKFVFATILALVLAEAIEVFFQAWGKPENSMDAVSY